MSICFDPDFPLSLKAHFFLELLIVLVFINKCIDKSDIILCFALTKWLAGLVLKMYLFSTTTEVNDHCTQKLEASSYRTYTYAWL